MKFKFHFLLIALSIFFQNCGSTQNTSSQATGNSPELTADKLTTDMIAQLKLSNEQTIKVKAINLKYINKMQDLRNQANEDRSTLRSLRTILQKDKNAEMKLVLTESQYRKYESIQSENKGGRGKRGSGGRGKN